MTLIEGGTNCCMHSTALMNTQIERDEKSEETDREKERERKILNADKQQCAIKRNSLTKSNKKKKMKQINPYRIETKWTNDLNK